MSILSDAVLMPLEGLHRIRREVGKTDYDSLNELYQKTINNIIGDLKSGKDPDVLVSQYKIAQRQIDYPDVTPLGAREQPKPKISSEGGKMSVQTFGYDRLKLTDSEYTNEELGQMIQAIHDDPHYKNKTGGTYILNPTGRKRSENIAWAITNRKMIKKQPKQKVPFSGSYEEHGPKWDLGNGSYVTKNEAVFYGDAPEIYKFDDQDYRNMEHLDIKRIEPVSDGDKHTFSLGNNEYGMFAIRTGNESKFFHRDQGNVSTLDATHIGKNIINNRFTKVTGATEDMSDLLGSIGSIVTGKQIGRAHV